MGEIVSYFRYFAKTGNSFDDVKNSLPLPTQCGENKEFGGWFGAFYAPNQPQKMISPALRRG
jgi:hypothetical protein